MFLVISLTIRFLLFMYPGSGNEDLILTLTRIIMYQSAGIVSVIFMLSSFEPVKGPLNWANVYPELRRKK